MSKTSNKSKVENLIQWIESLKKKVKPILTIYNN